jgi:hypothetical protein
LCLIGGPLLYLSPTLRKREGGSGAGSGPGPPEES